MSSDYLEKQIDELITKNTANKQRIAALEAELASTRLKYDALMDIMTDQPNMSRAQLESEIEYWISDWRKRNKEVKA